MIIRIISVLLALKWWNCIWKKCRTWQLFDLDGEKNAFNQPKYKIGGPKVNPEKTVHFEYFDRLYSISWSFTFKDLQFSFVLSRPIFIWTYDRPL